VRLKCVALRDRKAAAEEQARVHAEMVVPATGGKRISGENSKQRAPCDVS